MNIDDSSIVRYQKLRIDDSMLNGHFPYYILFVSVLFQMWCQQYYTRLLNYQNNFQREIYYP